MKNTKLLNDVNTSKPEWLKYFFFMGKTEKELIHIWYSTFVPETKRQKKFKKLVKNALTHIKHDYWISTLEPSEYHEDPIGEYISKIHFAEGECPAEFSGEDWIEKAKDFAPEWNSDLAEWYELILFYAYRIAKKYWTVHFVCDNSSYIGSPSDEEPTGRRQIGGFYDGIGNTRKITKYKSKIVLSGFYWLCSNCGYCCKKTISYFKYIAPDYREHYASGVIVLRQPPIELPSSISGIPKQSKEVNDFLVKAQNTISITKEFSDSVDFEESNKLIIACINKLNDILEVIKLDSSRLKKFTYLFEIYLPEFNNLLKLYADCQKIKGLTSKEKELLKESVGKFYNYLSAPQFETTLDKEMTLIQFNATAKTFIKTIEKEKK